MKTHSTDSRGGFTLLELVTAIAIAVLMLGLMVRVVSSMLQFANQSNEVMERTAEWATLVEQIESDFRSVVLFDGVYGTIHPLEPGESFQSEGWESVPVDTKPFTEAYSTDSDPANTFVEERWGKYGSFLGLLVDGARGGPNDPGGFYAISYQIKRLQLNAEGFPRYYLMRSQVSANNTFLSGYTLSAPEYLDGSYDSEAVWTASTYRHPNRNHILGNNVIDFGIRLYGVDASSGEEVMLFPDGSTGDEFTRHVSRLECFLRILSEEGAVQIENIEQGRTAQDWWTTAFRHSKVFRTSVSLNRN